MNKNNFASPALWINCINEKTRSIFCKQIPSNFKIIFSLRIKFGFSKILNKPRKNLETRKFCFQSFTTCINLCDTEIIIMVNKKPTESLNIAPIITMT